MGVKTSVAGGKRAVAMLASTVQVHIRRIPQRTIIVLKAYVV